MLVTKKVGGGIPYARKEEYEYDGVKYEADLKDGDIITILDEGSEDVDKWNNPRKVFKIKTRNGEKQAVFNQTTINVLHDEFGNDTKDWVNKDVKVLLVKKMIAGNKAIIAYFVTNEYGLDEYGEVIKEVESEDIINIDNY